MQVQSFDNVLRQLSYAAAVSYVSEKLPEMVSEGARYRILYARQSEYEGAVTVAFEIDELPSVQAFDVWIETLDGESFIYGEW